MRKWMTKTDAVILAVILLLSGAFFLWRSYGAKGEALSATVTVAGETVLEIPLSTLTQEKEFTLENGIVLTATPEGIRFTSSDCKDQICVHAGLLSKNGDVAACLPNQTVVSVQTEKTADLDAVTY